jgi:hypothetical protein
MRELTNWLERLYCIPDSSHSYHTELVFCNLLCVQASDESATKAHWLFFEIDLIFLKRIDDRRKNEKRKKRKGF